MKLKTPQSSKAANKVTKKRKRTWQEALWKLGEYNTGKMPDHAMENIGEDLIKWCLAERDDPSSRRLSVDPFFQDLGIPHSTRDGWERRNKSFKEMMDYARSIIGTKLKHGLMLKELDPKSTMFVLHSFDPEWKDMEAYHDERAKAVKADEDRTQDIRVVMEPFPTSPLVPKKED